MKCADCQFDYPEEILSQMFVNSGYTEPICGICAAKRVGVKRFRGETAEYYRLEAVEHRRKNEHRNRIQK